jgi:hypothetical protein
MNKPAMALIIMRIWSDKDVKVGDWVRDRAGEHGTGRVTSVCPYGCDLALENGGVAFLGLHWLEHTLPTSKKVALAEEVIFDLS